MKILLKNRELSAFLAILALFAVLVALNPSYFSLQTLGMIFASAQILILLAIGAALVMLTRNIDVSVGSTVGLSAIAVGVALNGGYSLPVSILFALSIGALAGAFNGFLVVGLRIPAIVATLGTLVGAFLGAFFLTQIDTVLVLFRLPAWWNDFIAGLVLLGVLVLDGRLRQALSRHQRALKYGRFQPGNRGGKHVTPFPKRNKEVA